MLSFAPAKGRKKGVWSFQIDTLTETLSRVSRFQFHHSMWHRMTPYLQPEVFNDMKVVARQQSWKNGQSYIYMDVACKDLDKLQISDIRIDEDRVRTYASSQCSPKHPHGYGKGLYYGPISVIMYDAECCAETTTDISWPGSGNGFKFELIEEDNGEITMLILGQSWFRADCYD